MREYLGNQRELKNCFHPKFKTSRYTQIKEIDEKNPSTHFHSGIKYIDNENIKKHQPSKKLLY